MKTLDNKKQYLNSKGLMQTFLDKEFLKGKVFCDYNTKIKENSNYTILHSLFLWIHKNIKISRDRDFNSKHKFRRNAKEIWESGMATGCTDYAIVFATLSRQLGIPTTILHTMSEKFVNNLNNNQCGPHTGHAFCECFYDGKWILIDPANHMFIGEYDEKIISLNYEVNGEKIFFPCDRNVDLKKQSIEEFNNNMDLLCENLKL